MRPQAEKQVKIRLALEKIVELEKLTATSEDLEEEYKNLAAAYNVEIEKVKQSVPVKEIEADIAVRKAIDLVKSSAEIKEVAKKSEAKPVAKKTTAKKTTDAAKETAAKKPAAKKTTTSTTKKPATKKATTSTAAKKTTTQKADK